MSDTDTCMAEFIDGTWETNDCPCEECFDYRAQSIEDEYEAGDITYEEAVAAHQLNGSWSPPVIAAQSPEEAATAMRRLLDSHRPEPK